MTRQTVRIGCDEGMFWTTIRAPKNLRHTRLEVMVNQAQLELQLKVWKELAISKQVLMRSAAEALKLDPNCSPDELKQALDGVLKKVAEVETSLRVAREEARSSIAGLEQKLSVSTRAHATAQATADDLLKKQESAAQQMAAERLTATKEAQKLKDKLAEKEKALKAINTALADTPENVVKKMNALKKQKQDEADARRQVEGSFTALRAEKQQQDKKLSEMQARGTKLVTQHRDLHALCEKLLEQLKPTVTDAKSLPTLPELDMTLLEEVEKGEASPAKKENGKKE